MDIKRNLKVNTFYKIKIKLFMEKYVCRYAFIGEEFLCFSMYQGENDFVYWVFEMLFLIAFPTCS